jgi:anaerobic ribonucleoside-triphosphate reductase activating protein
VSEALRIHHFEPASRVNGPGLRAVLWVQGCTLGCTGCFNPETHIRTAGESRSVDDLFDEIRNTKSIEGLTISGGEPLQQLPALAKLLARVRAGTKLSIVVFTGFSWDEAQRIPGFNAMLPSIDVLIAGRFNKEKRTARSLIGSSNKTFRFLTGRYTQADFDPIPEAEVYIGAEGQISFSGIDPLQW